MAYKGSTDQPARVDMFGISSYISGLCDFIADCETPMTIAIQGDWGSGKTSVMEMVRDSIDKRAVHCCWFNTWQYSQFNTSESLSLAFIESVVEDLGIGDGDSVKEMRSGISKLGNAMAFVGKRALVAGTELVVGSTTAADVRNAMDKIGNGDKTVVETISTLKERFQDCIIAACEKNKVDRILVFVDDLDRLQPLRAVELLEVLKIFLDCEKCVFVLALDYNVVVSGVKQKYGSDFEADKGRSFFDKIIQVPFKMPVAQYDIYNFVKKTFEYVAQLTCEDYDAKNFVALINSSIGSNPRSMKRLFNSFLLLLKVVGSDMQDPLGKKILFAILCMQQHFEGLYNHIVINRDDLTPEFLEQLANDDEDIETLLKREGIETDGAEPEKIQEFMKHFNRVLATDGETVDNNKLNQLRALLSSSSITATTTTTTTKKRATFVYKGDTYMARGANKMNLANFALRLILDYVKDTDKTADQLMDMINSEIPCQYSDIKKDGWQQICDRKNPSLNKRILEYYFTDKNEVVRIGDRELLVLKGWGGVYEINQLVEILGYSDVVSSNM